MSNGSPNRSPTSGQVHAPGMTAVLTWLCGFNLRQAQPTIPHRVHTIRGSSEPLEELLRRPAPCEQMIKAERSWAGDEQR